MNKKRALALALSFKIRLNDLNSKQTKLWDLKRFEFRELVVSTYKGFT